MFYNPTKSVFKRMSIELGMRKDILVITEDADAAQVVAQNMRDEIELLDHVDSGKMLNSITATVRDGENVVTGVTYAKYVDGYDQEKGEQGFIQPAVDAAILDGYYAEKVV